MNGDIFMKKLISLLMAISLLVCSLNSWGLVASAAKKVTTTIKNFSASTNLNAEQYGAIREGSYTAVKKSDGWYYKFVRNNQEVFVKATAFSSSCGNDYSSVNSSLTKGVMRTDGKPTEKTFVYKKRTSTTSSTVKGFRKLNDKKIAPNVKNKTYTTYIAWLSIISNRVGTEVDLECCKKSHVQFVYADKVYIKDVKKGEGYKTPETSSEYKQALKRDTSYSISTTITPKFTLSITKPGTSKVTLNSCMLRGKGSTDTKTDLTKFIDVALTIKDITASIATGSFPYKSLYSLYKQGSTMKKGSSEYQSNKKIYLSYEKDGKDYSCLKSNFKSPIKLKSYNDYFRAEVRLSAAPAVKGTKTQISASFTIV